MRPGVSFFAEATDLVFLVRLEGTLGPFDAALTFEGEDVRTPDDERKKTVVADDHGASQRSSRSPLRARPSSRRRVADQLVDDEHIAPAPRVFSMVTRFRCSPPDSLPRIVLLLVLALEVEGADVGARGLMVTVNLRMMKSVRGLDPDVLRLSRWYRVLRST